MELIISNDRVRLRAARQAVLDGTPWQRCQGPLQQNAQAYVPRKAMQAEVAERIGEIFNPSSQGAAEQLLKAFVENCAGKALQLAERAEANLPERLTVFAFPKHPPRQLRTTNVVERLQSEIRRRTRGMGILPNEASCLGLMSTMLMEQSESRETERIFLRFEEETARSSP